MTTLQPRLVALDLDGTLLDPQGRVAPRSAAAISALSAAGVRIVLATGRSPWSVRPIALQLGLGGDHIMMQGGLVGSAVRDTTRWSAPMSAPLVLEHLAFAREHDLEPILGHREGYWAERLAPDVLALSWPTYDEGSHMALVPDLERIAGDGVIRTFLFTSPARHATIRRSARARFGDRTSITWGDEFGIELLAPGVSKGAALARLAAGLGLSMDTVAAAGDGRNDLEMLALAGRSAAMAAARPEVQKAAQRVVPSNADDGALVALLEWFPWLGDEPGVLTGAPLPGVGKDTGSRPAESAA